MIPLESALPSEWLPGPQASEREPRVLVSISAPVAILISITQIPDYSHLQKKVVRRQEGPSLKNPTLYNYKVTLLPF